MKTLRLVATMDCTGAGCNHSHSSWTCQVEARAVREHSCANFEIK